MDETDGMSNNQQRRVKAESYVSETYETKNSVAGANNKSKESLSPLATSEDLVDEELANMENAESLDAACKKVLAYAVSFYQPLILKLASRYYQTTQDLLISLSIIGSSQKTR